MTSPRAVATVEHPATLFAALADPTRHAVLQHVAETGSCTATEIARRVPVSRQAVSRHLVVLADAGLVVGESTGRETRYRVVPGSLDPARAWIDATDRDWSRRLGRLRDHLARRVVNPPG